MLGMLGLYIATFISATLNFLIVGMIVFILDRYIFLSEIAYAVCLGVFRMSYHCDDGVCS